MGITLQASELTKDIVKIDLDVKHAIDAIEGTRVLPNLGQHVRSINQASELARQRVASIAGDDCFSLMRESFADGVGRVQTIVEACS
eukprot:m.159257 g.159257  ORF g.159257 m.159257 type:complete len:87 (-) comp16485_c0_seq3:285-545(-)